jgi:hypothetical protein
MGTLGGVRRIFLMTAVMGIALGLGARVAAGQAAGQAAAPVAGRAAAPVVVAVAVPAPMTNDDVARMVALKVDDDAIIAAIQSGTNNFDVSNAALTDLHLKNVSAGVLAAMAQAVILRISPDSAAAKLTLTKVPVNPPPSPQTPAPAKPAAAQNPAHTQARLDAARAAKPVGTIKPHQWICRSPKQLLISPPPDLGPTGGLFTIQFDWTKGASLPTDIAKSGTTCIELEPEFNDLLFTPKISLARVELQGSAFDLITDAISKLTSFSLSSATNQAVANKASGQPPALFMAPLGVDCPADLPDDITTASKAAGGLADAFSKIQLSKDSAGKYVYVERRRTMDSWPAIEAAYGSFETAVMKVVDDLNDPKAKTCTASVLSEAEALVLETYGPSRQRYSDMAPYALQKDDTTVRLTAPLDSTENYDATVTPRYGGADTNSPSQTGRFNAGHKLLTASAGMLITQLPGRSYSSVTVPVPPTMANPNPMPATQSVLGVDYSSGPRPALAALVNFHPPVSWLEGKQWGFGLSGGLVLDVANGKADTSHFGYFVGGSLRLTPYLYITPGVHVGEFADFPLGYVKGTVIPANIGTPAAQKRYTARFAVAVTLKVRDLFQPAAQSNKPATTVNATPNPSAGGNQPAGNGGKKTGS